MIKQVKTAFVLLILFTLLTGLIYPGIVTGLAQLLFPWQANGSLVQQDNKIIGSELIGQSFTDPKYFWGRPSVRGGSNSGPTHSDFLKTLRERVAHLQQADLQNHSLIPVDLITASASGLDPEISPEAAYYQVHRIAQARKISEQAIIALIQNRIKGRSLKVLGEPRVNVLLLNLALDKL